MQGFHSTNVSECVNYQVAAILEKLRATELTKSRPRRSNNNALAESKNGSAIRKVVGRWHSAGPHSERLNSFHRQILAPPPNCHRPSLVPHVETDAKGKQRKTYRQADIRAPHEVPKPTPEAERHLPGVTFAELRPADRERPGYKPGCWESAAERNFRAVEC